MAVSATSINITSEFGNDASLDITSKRGSGRYVDAASNVQLSNDPDDLHQGTVARDDYFTGISKAPSNPNMENNPYSFLHLVRYKIRMVRSISYS